MMEDDYKLPTDGQEIVRVVRSCGNNLHEVETANEKTENFLGNENKDYMNFLGIYSTDKFPN